MCCTNVAADNEANGIHENRNKKADRNVSVLIIMSGAQITKPPNASFPLR